MVDILRKCDIFIGMYDEIKYYAVFKISEDEMRNILENEVPSSDLILSQPVSATYKNNEIYSTDVLRKTALSHGKTHYVISNCYFTGYDPVPFQTTDGDGNIIHVGNITYFPSLSIDNLIMGNIEGSCVEWCNPNAYGELQLRNNLFRTLDQLKLRERKIFDGDYGVDITISDYIERNFREIRLFHTYNHPTNAILIELVKRLMKRLGLPFSPVILDYELLGEYSIPPPPSVYYGYNMTFVYPKFIIKQKEYSTYEAMKIFRNTLANSDPNLHNRWKSSISWGIEKLK
jgi:hypothetical protein